MDKRNKKKGFTLIEMIVVVAIIAILTGIAVPQVTKQINNSKKRADVANAKSIATAIQQKITEGNTITETTGTTYLVVPNDIFGVNNVPTPQYTKDGVDVFVYRLIVDSNVLEVGVAKNGTTLSNIKVLYPTIHADYK